MAVERITIEGITYNKRQCGTNVHTGMPIFDLTRISKHGRPLKQSRPATIDPAGRWVLGPWVRF